MSPKRKRFGSNGPSLFLGVGKDRQQTPCLKAAKAKRGPGSTRLHLAPGLLGFGLVLFSFTGAGAAEKNQVGSFFVFFAQGPIWEKHPCQQHPYYEKTSQSVLEIPAFWGRNVDSKKQAYGAGGGEGGTRSYHTKSCRGQGPLRANDVDAPGSGGAIPAA